MSEKRLRTDIIEESLGKLGLNQSLLAEKLGVSRETVSQWLKNNKYPRPAKLLHLSELLGLSFDELVVKMKDSEPQIAFRSHRNRKVSEDMVEKAQDMGNMLKFLVPYLPHESFFKAPVLESPLCEREYIQNVVRFLRKEMNITNDYVELQDILQEFSNKKVVVIPVLWGESGDNALHIRLKRERVTFIYVNIDSRVTDFKFWLLHELAHIITPELEGNNADTFADLFAAAFLFPEEYAEYYYNKWRNFSNAGALVENIRELAAELLISPLTIYTQLNSYAELHNLPEFSLNIHPAVTNFNKEVQSVSVILFGEERPAARRYVEICDSVFNTHFFGALASYLEEKEKGPGMIQRIMDIPFLDAKGVFRALVGT